MSAFDEHREELEHSERLSQLAEKWKKDNESYEFAKHRVYMRRKAEERIEVKRNASRDSLLHKGTAFESLQSHDSPVKTNIYQKKEGIFKKIWKKLFR